MFEGFKKAGMLFLFTGLVGCAHEAPAPTQAGKHETEKTEIARFSDLQLCQAEDALDASLSVNPSSHPEYNDNLKKLKVLQQEKATRHINCYRVKHSNALPAKPLSSQQKNKRANLVCQSYAQRAQYAGPQALTEMCASGYRSTASECRSKLAAFGSEARKVPLSARAEYIEVSNAYRMGCNLR